MTVSTATGRARPPTTPRGVVGLSALVSLVACDTATTRAGLARATGQARSTVSVRVDGLVARGVLIEQGVGASSGGRPPTVLRLNPAAGLLLAADLGATHYRLAVADLGGEPLAEAAGDVDVTAGPQHVLRGIDEGFATLLDGLGRDRREVRAVGIGVPGPVEFSTGTVIRPPIMPGWDGYRVPDFFAGRYDAPVLVDNDVNVMALAEYRARRTEAEHLLFVKIGTGIGCGIVAHGVLHRGADGAAGDIGHLPLPHQEDTVCACGNTGCVEAVASGAALARALQAAGLDVATGSDVVRLTLEGNPLARRAVRVASQHIGEVLASLVSFYNPGTIVVGGALAELQEELLAGIRGVVYRRALPLATRSVRIEQSVLGRRAGVVGGLALARDQALSPAGLDVLLQTAAHSA